MTLNSPVDHGSGPDEEKDRRHDILRTRDTGELGAIDNGWAGSG